MFLALILSISFYHGLTTEQFVAPSGKRLAFDYAGYIEHLGQTGVKRTRVFAELPWYWRYDLGPAVRPVFNGRLASLPYAYLPARKTWDFTQPNLQYSQRIQKGAEIADEYGMNILICIATQGPDLKCPYFSRVGYSRSREYYENANAPAYKSNGAWKRLLKHFQRVASATKNFAQQYQYYEPYNEHSSLNAAEELTAINQSVSRVRRTYKIQLNVPNPLYEVRGFASTRQYLAWLRKLLQQRDGYQVSRLSFHRIYTGQGVHRLAAILRSAGISPARCEISTDGATPWKGRFSEQSSRGHYLARRYWKQTAASRKAVFDAHLEIVKAAKQEGFAVCDIQDVIKWAGDLDFTNPDIQSFHAKLVSAAR